jgi:integrase
MRELAFEPLARAVVAAYTGRDPSFAARVEFWIGVFGSRPVDAIKTDDIEDGIDLLVKRGKRKVTTWGAGQTPKVEATGKPLAPSSINRYLSTLGTVFKDLRRLRLLPRGFVNPMRGVGRMSESEGRTLTVTVEDVKRLVAACRVSRNRKLAALVAMACTTGWRLGNLQALRWGDIDLKVGHADAERTKNGTSHRTPLLPWVVDELKRIQPLHAEPGELVFGRKNFKRAWQSALKLADLPEDWTFHHCRHIAASVLAQSGASVVVIMQALNHKTPAMALRYSHLSVDALRDGLGRAWGTA